MRKTEQASQQFSQAARNSALAWSFGRRSKANPSQLFHLDSQIGTNSGLRTLALALKDIYDALERVERRLDMKGP